MLMDSAPPSIETLPVLSQKQQLPASESPRTALLTPAWDFGVTKGSLSQSPTALPVQGQHSGLGAGACSSPCGVSAWTEMSP